MTDYPNWFSNDGQTNFQNVLVKKFKDKPLRALQIGSYTGDASIWLASNVMTHPGSVLFDVDTWEGSDEVAHHQMNWQSVEAVYDAKTVQWRNDRKIVKCKTTSDWFFKNNREVYDFIYIDGDHTSYGVIKDAVNAYECLNDGGIIAFDDYKWSGAHDPADRPQMAINAFLEIYRKRVEVIVNGYQLWVSKIG